MNAAEAAGMAAALIAVDPSGIGGVCIRSQPHPARDQWLTLLREILPAPCPIRRIPCNIDDGRLLGGLDLTATLRANRPICERGVLAAVDGGVVVLAMAERASAHTAACIAKGMDTHEIELAREGFDARFPARFGLVAMDEGCDEDALRPTLMDRLAILLSFEDVSARIRLMSPYDVREVDAARELLPRVSLDDALVVELCEVALALGIASPRVSLLAVRVARVAAALAGRLRIQTPDAVLAGQLVLAPRATRVPPREAEDTQSDPPSEPGEATPPPEASSSDPPDDRPRPAAGESTEPPAGESTQPSERCGEPAADVVLEAAVAALPRGLLARLADFATALRSGPGSVGRSGHDIKSGRRGRPLGILAAAPRGDARLNLSATLRAAAPWQGLRGHVAGPDARLRIQVSDLRITRHQQRAPSLTLFAVDASGSSAANRLAEAKGAVELLLAECYIRRDRVGVIAFRNRTAEIVLPPTRSLVRAKRALSGMVGGGGTPLADALSKALDIAVQAQRRGETPTLVLLSDGQANVGRAGSAGRALAQADALTAARSIRAIGMTTLFIDTAPRPSSSAQSLSTAMGARYFPLPFGSSKLISGIVREGAAGSRR